MLLTFLKITFALIFRSGRFYCRLNAGNRLDFKVWEAPAKWCSEKEFKQILADLQEVVNDQNPKEIPDYGVLTGDREDLKNRIITIAYDPTTQKPVGFAAQKFLDLDLKPGSVRVLHLGLTWIKPPYRNRSLLGNINIIPMLLVLIKYGFRSIWISNVSQVPAIIGGVANVLRSVYPDPYGKVQQQPMHRRLATAIMQDHRPSFGVGPEAPFDLNTQIIKNAYTGGSDNIKKSFEDTAHHRDAVVNDFCHKHLDYNRGDDFLQVGLLEKSVIYDFLNDKSGVIEKEYAFIAKGVMLFFQILAPLFRAITFRRHKFHYQ